MNIITKCFRLSKPILVTLLLLTVSNASIASNLFTIKQKINLTDISTQWDNVILKCALICGQLPSDINQHLYSTKENTDSYSSFIFRGRVGMKFYNHLYIAALSREYVIPINKATGIVNKEQRIYFQQTPGYRPENIGAYSCAIDIVGATQNTRTRASDEAYNNQGSNTLPSQIGLKTIVAKNFNNPARLWTPNNNQVCKPDKQ